MTTRVAIPDLISPSYFPAIAAVELGFLPDAKLELLYPVTKTYEELREGRLDAGVLALPIHDDQLHAEFLFEEPFVLAVPEQHALSKRKALKLDDLSDQTLLLLEDGHCLKDHALAACNRPELRAHAAMLGTSLHTLVQMVDNGLGLTFIMWGIISNIYLFCFGLIVAVIGLVFWVLDLRHEYSE